MNTLIKPPCCNTNQVKQEIPWLNSDVKNAQHSLICKKLRDLGVKMKQLNIQDIIVLTSVFCGDYSVTRMIEPGDRSVSNLSINIDYLKEMSGKYCKVNDVELYMIFPEVILQVLTNTTYKFEFSEDSIPDSFRYTILVEQHKDIFEAYIIEPFGYVYDNKRWPITFADMSIGGSVTAPSYMLDVRDFYNAQIRRTARLTDAEFVKEVVTTNEAYYDYSTILLPVKFTLHNMSIVSYREALDNSTAYTKDELQQLQKVYAIDPIVTYYNPVDDTLLVVQWKDFTGYDCANYLHLVNFNIDYDYIEVIHNYNMLSLNYDCALDGNIKEDIVSSCYTSFKFVVLDVVSCTDALNKPISDITKPYYEVVNITNELVTKPYEDWPDPYDKTVRVKAELCFNTKTESLFE